MAKTQPDSSHHLNFQRLAVTRVSKLSDLTQLESFPTESEIHLVIFVTHHERDFGPKIRMYNTLKLCKHHSYRYIQGICLICMEEA